MLLILIMFFRHQSGGLCKSPVIPVVSCNKITFSKHLLSMTKKILIIISFIISTIGFTQELSYNIFSGNGIDELQLGISKSSALDLIGDPDTVYNQTQERKYLQTDGMKDQNWLQHKIGFDTAFYYSNGTTKGPGPVYSLFFKENKLVLILLTTKGGYKNKWLKQFTIDNNLKLKASKKSVLKEYGQPDIILDYSPSWYKYDCLIYYTQGISFIIFKEQILSIQIFEKNTANNL